MARTTDKLKNFEANYNKLAELVSALEAPDLTLKESLDLYEKAIKLSETCDSALEYAKQKAQTLADIHAGQEENEGLETPSLSEKGTLDL